MLVTRYLHALQTADPGAAIALFAAYGVGYSPLHGTLPATGFYPGLFADTSASHLTLRFVMHSDDEGTPTIAFWFDFAWLLANGDLAPFTVMDVAKLDDQGRIAQLPIFYDPAPIRAAFDRQRAARPRS